MTDETTPATPSWMVGMGADVDMKGDPSDHKPFRFWLKAGSERQIVFLSTLETAPVIWEHQYQSLRNNQLKWGFHETCIKRAGMPCPMCELADDLGKYGRQKVRLFSILDMTPWTHKTTGKTYPYSKIILAAKHKTSELIMRRHIDLIDEGKSLRGASFKVYRSAADKSASVGDDYTFKGMFDLSGLPAEDAKEHDWITILAPNFEKLKSEADKCRRRMGGAAPTASTFPVGGGSGVGFEEPPVVEVEY